MGCCSSKVPSFPPPSAADGILPLDPPDDDCRYAIKVIPNPSMVSQKIGIFLPNDISTPSYMFAPKANSMSCYKIVNPLTGGDVETVEVGTVKIGSEHTTTDSEIASAQKTLTVSSKDSMNAREDKVNITKISRQDPNGLRTWTSEFDNGYAMTKDIPNKCEILTKNGEPIAYIYDGNKDNMSIQMIRGPSDMKKFMKSPIAIYIKSSHSETELALTLCLVGAANDRLIPLAWAGDQGGANNDDIHRNHYDNYDNNNFQHSSWGGDGGGGGGWGGDGGGGGWGGDGGGGDGGGDCGGGGGGDWGGDGGGGGGGGWE